jgi:hypothetical protein
MMGGGTGMDVQRGFWGALGFLLRVKFLCCRPVRCLLYENGIDLCLCLVSRQCALRGTGVHEGVLGSMKGLPLGWWCHANGVTRWSAWACANAWVRGLLAGAGCGSRGLQLCIQSNTCDLITVSCRSN